MATTTVEQILEEITALHASEQARLRQLINKQPRQKEPLSRFVAPIPEPDPQPSMQWLREHSEEYAEQWVALDGDRLIAHGTNAQEVFDAANADGAYLPLVTFIERKPEHSFVRV